MYPSVETAQIIRTFFLAEALGIILFSRIPTLRNRYLGYGLRALPPGNESSKDAGNREPLKEPKTSLFDGLVRYPMPHEYFAHFYFLSVTSSLFWGHQIVSQGSFLRAVSQHNSLDESKRSMSLERVALCWSLVAIQGVRRLYETITLYETSRSSMSFSQYILGISYYLVISISIWIEGTGSIISNQSIFQKSIFSAPSIRTIMFLPIFILASGVQYDCHIYLASLPKYTLPVHPAFLHIVSPHYTAECFIYLALTFLAAPRGSLVNFTVLSNLVFVVVNLGSTSDMNRSWYAKKFGIDKVANRWRMIPWVW